MMAYCMPLSEKDLQCPTCHEVFVLPVTLKCSHTICKVCVEKHWEWNGARECPVCRAVSPTEKPAINLALKMASDSFKQRKLGLNAEPLCDLHGEQLKVFCLTEEEPICVVCQVSNKHSRHSYCPVEEAASERKREISARLTPLQKQLKALNATKEDWIETELYIKIQADKTDRQIKKEFETLHTFLWEEEAARLAVLREEEIKKAQIVKKRLENITKTIAVLSDTIDKFQKSVETDNLSFLRDFKQTKSRMLYRTPEVERIPGALIDVPKHLGLLKFNVWKKMLETINHKTTFEKTLKNKWTGLTTGINLRIQDAVGQIAGAVERVGRMEEAMADMERWDIGVKDTLTQLLSDQRVLQDKVSDLEGCFRHNNIRIYGVPEDAEGTSAAGFVESLIKSELGDSLGWDRDHDLGIERAHRAFAPKPPAKPPPPSMVVRFHHFSVKEKILHTTWKKQPSFQTKRVYFDHDYAADVQNKRKEYIPIKKKLKERGIRFQTPLTRMRVFFESGTVLYNSVMQAAEDLRKRGFTLGKAIRGTERKGITEETLARLLPWETTEPRNGREKTRFQRQVRERLKYRRIRVEFTAEDE
ncbi:hypothetical protein COCON_G00110700 [Conger conger]|uniref:Uncharacterized protein n=1 Tax=Conger conger TaxID=82655 RepID=A0A9Q1DJS4_CONCO|nr:hypothetical protein COCON_G00110700 [Conger conger]